ADRINWLDVLITKPPASRLAAPARELLMRARAATAENHLKQQRPELAVEQFKLAFKESPQPITDRIFLGLVWAFPTSLLSYGYRDEAILLMREFEPSFSDRAPYLAQMGFFYMNSESAQDAVRVLTRAV